MVSLPKKRKTKKKKKKIKIQGPVHKNLVILILKEYKKMDDEKTKEEKT